MTLTTLICLLGLLLTSSLIHLSIAKKLENDETTTSEGHKNDLDASTLRIVHVLYRHGDRSQISPYANDKYNESDWPQGYGQLTTTGMEQAYNLGLFFKERYVKSGFINSSYKRTEVHVRSTTLDRALMTAYSVLAGLFPPAGNQVWNDKIAWQPIPVHTVASDKDYLLRPGEQCPTYDEVNSEMQKNNPVYNATMQKYEDFYKYVSEHSGEPNDWQGVGHVLDPLFCQAMNKKTLPDWVMNDTMQTVIELRDVYASLGFPPNIAYLKGGLLVGEVLDHMLNRSVDGSLTEKLFMYSAHDSTVDAFTATLGVSNNKQPPYTACVIVELLEPSEGKFVVQMLYRNESDHPPYPLKLKHCDNPCPLDKFAQIMKSSIPTDLQAECGIVTPVPSMFGITNSGATVAVAILTLILLMIMVIGAIICFLKRNKLRENHDYAPVPMEMS